MSNTISMENAVFLQEHKQEIDEIIVEFKRLRAKILSNTLLQLTRWDIIQKFYDVSPFVDQNEITENTLKLIVSCMEDAKEVVDSDSYKRLESAVRTFSKLKSSNPEMFK